MYFRNISWFTNKNIFSKVTLKYHISILTRPLWNLSLLHIRTIYGVISWYVLDIQNLFHFIAYVSFLSISLFFLIFWWSLYCLMRYWGKFVKKLQKSSGVVPRFLSGVSRSELFQSYLVINVTGLAQFGKKLNYILSPLAS